MQQELEDALDGSLHWPVQLGAKLLQGHVAVEGQGGEAGPALGVAKVQVRNA